MEDKKLEDEICELCRKPKSKHIICSINKNILWCYPNSQQEGYNKKHLKKWDYQFTPKSQKV